MSEGDPQSFRQGMLAQPADNGTTLRLPAVAPPGAFPVPRTSHRPYVLNCASRNVPDLPGARQPAALSNSADR